MILALQTAPRDAPSSPNAAAGGGGAATGGASGGRDAAVHVVEISFELIAVDVAVVDDGDSYVSLASASAGARAPPVA